MSYSTQEDGCPNCGAVSGGITEIEGGIVQPRAGGVCVCGNCAHLLLFNEDLSLRLATEQEYKQFSAKLTSKFDFVTIFSLMMASAYSDMKFGPRVTITGVDSKIKICENIGSRVEY